MAQLTVTVAVSAYGRPDQLACALAALAAGSERPDEVIVVDQAPSEVARRVVDQLGDLPHRYLEQSRLGLSASRNLALASTNTTIVAVTDDDCVPDEHWVAAIRAAFSVEDSPAAVTGPVLPLEPVAPGRYMVSARERKNVELYDHQVVPWYVGSGGNFAATVSALRAVGGWDERLGTGSKGRAAEDIELFDRMLRQGLTIRYDPAAIVRHELQDAERRLATRWSYAAGVGAFLALSARRCDAMAARALCAYLRMHVVSLVRAVARLDRFDVQQHSRAVAGLFPGLWYGLRLPAGGPATDG